MASRSNNDHLKEYQNMFGSNLSLALHLSSITDIPFNACALINCTGPRFEHYVGISKAIVQKAGPKLLENFSHLLNQFSKLEFGQVVCTPAYNFDNHEHIFHVRSPSSSRRYTFVNNIQTNLNEIIYYNILKKAFVELELESIALPLIGTGAAGISIQESAFDLVQALYRFRSDFSLKKPGSIYVVNNNTNILAEAESHMNRKMEILERPKSSIKTEPVVKKEDAENECTFCLEIINNPKALDKCGHKFCAECIDNYFARVKKVCPICNTCYGQVRGNQPNGTMTHRVLNMTLPGYSQGVKTIEITYSIPNGIQDSSHPNGGQPYHGTTRLAYLPDTNEGRKVLGLLRKAFEQKLIFTIGQSRTTGADNVVTWNDIHHKTRVHGGPAFFGYPDPNYLDRVLQELANKGIS